MRWRSLGWRPLVLGVLVAVLLTLMFNRGENPTELIEPAGAPRSAKVATVDSLTTNQTSTLIGNVRPLRAVSITPDRSGRVTRVNTSLGAQVAPGQILVELENASERAALLQAEGAYEAARAQANLNDIGLDEAETRLRAGVTTGQNVELATYTTLSSVIRNPVDSLFSDPNSPIPGLRIDARSDTAFLNQERVIFGQWLYNLQSDIIRSSEPEHVMSALVEQIAQVDRLMRFVDIIITHLADQRSVRGFSASEVASLQAEFSLARSQLVSALNNLNSAKSGIESALDGVRRAKTLASSSVGASQTDAQLKQALGTLRAAQANYEKTLLRTPIAGTINSLNVRVGDFVSAFTPLAEVANNSQLEVVTFVPDNERVRLAIGQVVMVGNATGTVTAIAPAVDTRTRRTEVRISTSGDNLRAGDTVRVKLTQTHSTTPDATVSVPLTALKLTNGSHTVLGLENDVVVPIPVTVGTIRGGNVEILSGLNRSDEFIIDARPFKTGDEVTVIR